MIAVQLANGATVIFPCYKSFKAWALDMDAKHLMGNFYPWKVYVNPSRQSS